MFRTNVQEKRFSDESNNHLNRYINQETTRFLRFQRPDVIILKDQQHRVTIWCSVSGHDIIGTYFVKNEVTLLHLLWVI